MRSVCEYVYQHAQKTPSKLCLVDSHTTVTYQEYWESIKKTAAVLRKYGIKNGSIVVLESTQMIASLSLELAVQLLHGVYVPLEKNCGQKKIEEISQKTEADLVVCEQVLPLQNSVTYKQLECEIIQSSCYETGSFPELDDVSEILFSTGTTGEPKGIVLTNRNNIALAQNIIEGVEMGKDNIEIIPVPLNHSHGLRRYYGNMVNGSTVIIMNGVLDIKRFYQYLDTYQVTAVDLVPASLAVIFKLSGDKLQEYKNQLQYIQLGGAPLPEEHKKKLCFLLPHTRLYNFYGSTESGCTCILNFNEGIERPHCIGKPTVNASFITVDESGNVFPATSEKPGFLATKGPMNMKEYYQDTQGTANVLFDGYLYTNDLAYMCDDYIYLMGRKGDVINVGGSKVAPQEIEDLVLAYPGISDCACISIPDSMKGSVPKLFIVKSGSLDTTNSELMQYLMMNLESYKIPKKIQEIDSIPRTFNGKILRSKLQQLNIQ